MRNDARKVRTGGWCTLGGPSMGTALLLAGLLMAASGLTSATAAQAARRSPAPPGILAPLPLEIEAMVLRDDEIGSQLSVATSGPM
ncbi:MAG: hypothetical protein OES47_13805, partial [Acidobacteriota bacterium]|nr:hypothetical protein [Acidobacteriota bacterium]